MPGGTVREQGDTRVVDQWMGNKPDEVGEKSHQALDQIIPQGRTMHSRRQHALMNPGGALDALTTPGGDASVASANNVSLIESNEAPVTSSNDTPTVSAVPPPSIGGEVPHS